MTKKEYAKLVKAHRLRGGRTIAACKTVLVDRLTIAAVARKIGIAESTMISQAHARLRRPLCPTCGQPLRNRENLIWITPNFRRQGPTPTTGEAKPPSRAWLEAMTS